MKTIIFATTAALITVTANAQTASMRGNISTSTQVSTLRNAMESAIAQLREELAAFKRCANKNMVFAPDNPDADTNHCIKATYADCHVNGKTYKSGEPVAYTHFPGIVHSWPTRCTGSSDSGMGHCNPAGSEVIASPSTVLKVCVDGQVKAIERQKLSEAP